MYVVNLCQLSFSNGEVLRNILQSLFAQSKMKNFYSFSKTCFTIIFFAATINVVAFAEGPDVTSAGTASQQAATPEVAASTQVAPNQASKKSFNLRSSGNSSTTANDAATKVNTPAANSTTSSQNKVNSVQNSTQARSAVSSSSQAAKSQSSASTAPSTAAKQNQSEPIQQNPSAPATTQPQPQQKSNPTPPAAPTSSQNQAEPANAETEGEKSSAEVASTKTTAEKKEEKPQPPEDLPKVDSSEMDFPEVAAPSATQEQAGSLNYWAGLIGWACLLVGVAIIIFVMLKGRSNPEMPVQKVHGSKKRRHKKKHLLSDDYYWDKF